MKDISLADFIIESGKYAKKPWRPLLRELGGHLAMQPRENLPFTKRFLYDQKARDVVKGFENIPFSDFNGQFKHLLLPFDKFWIENTLSKPENEVPGEILRSGFLIEKANGEMKTRFASEFCLPPRSREGEETAADMGYYTRDGHFVIAPDVDIMLNAKGVYVLDQSSGYFDEASKKQRRKAIFQCTELAEEIYRMLVLISSRNVHTNLIDGLPESGEDAAPGFLTPIRIDLAVDMQQAFINRDDKKIKTLLGWTDVMRHRRTYHTLDGPVKLVIQPHDRRIKAPVDRRKTARILTASNSNLELEFTDEGSRIVIPKGKSKKSRINKPMAEAESPKSGKGPQKPANILQRLWQKLHR